MRDAIDNSAAHHFIASFILGRDFFKAGGRGAVAKEFWIVFTVRKELYHGLGILMYEP